MDAVLNPNDSVDERISRLLDRLMRGSLHYLDEAEEYRALIRCGLTTQELAARIGRTPATVRRKLRLNNLGEETAKLLRRTACASGMLRSFCACRACRGRLRVLKHVTDGGLSVKETEKLIDDVLSHMPVPMAGGGRMKPLMRDYRLYVNAIRGIVEQMCDAGLEATMQVNVGKRVAEVRICVPTFAQGLVNEVRPLLPSTLFSHAIASTSERIPSICEIWHTVNRKVLPSLLLSHRKYFF